MFTHCSARLDDAIESLINYINVCANFSLTQQVMTSTSIFANRGTLLALVSILSYKTIFGSYLYLRKIILMRMGMGITNSGM